MTTFTKFVLVILGTGFLMYGGEAMIRNIYDKDYVKDNQLVVLCLIGLVLVIGFLRQEREEEEE